ncbi:MAG: Dabb family protein [Clostridiaceae bacterium]|nr:Dabb family protein [Clostridiaceae bacterium]
MVVHIVMWTLKDFAEGRTKEENAVLLQKRLEELKNSIPEIKHIEAGRNFNNSPAAYDVVLYSEFSDKEGLAAYQIHPEHQKVAALVGAVTESRAVTDYER